MKLKITTALLLLSQFSSAVMLNNNGKGEFHIIPIYATGNKLYPQVTITNDSNTATAVKIHIKKPLNSSPVFSYNVYLTPYDSWSFAMGKVILEGESILALASSDTSCTPALDLYNVQYQTIDIQHGPEQIGSIEVIEMGKADAPVTGVPYPFPTDSSTGVPDCQTTNQAFASSGIWDAEEPFINEGMTPPDNSLLVEASLLQSFNGSQYTVPVTTFADFFADEMIYHTKPASHLPTLESANNEALLWVEDEPMVLDFDSGIDAINALLLKSSLKAPFITFDGIDAINTISLALPTKTFNSTSSEDEICDTTHSQSFDYHLIDRSGNQVPLQNNENLSFCGNASILKFNHNRSIFNVHNETVLNGTALDVSHLNTKEGVFMMTFSDPLIIEGTDSNTNQTYAFQGMPVIATIFNSATNAQATPGLLAKYGTSQPILGEPIISVVNSSKEQ